jgi:head-tail adaptor
MKAGTLDRKVTLQRKSETLSASGEPVVSWGTLVQRLSASVSPTRGDESFTQPQLRAKQTTTFRVRWHQAIADLTPQDRIIYPAIGAGEEPEPTAIYDILAVHELGRRETLEIIAFRRADT